MHLLTQMFHVFTSIVQATQRRINYKEGFQLNRNKQKVQMSLITCIISSQFVHLLDIMKRSTLAIKCINIRSLKTYLCKALHQVPMCDLQQMQLHHKARQVPVENKGNQFDKLKPYGTRRIICQTSNYHKPKFGKQITV